MVNRVILIGNLGKDPEVRRLENGAVVAKFSIATNENYRDKSGEWQKLTEWHDVVVWRSLAERAEATLKKGTMIYLEGKLTHRSWQDQDGNNRRTTEVVASYFRAVGPRREDNMDTSSDAHDAHSTTSGNNKSQAEAVENHVSQEPSPPLEVNDSAADDLPF